MWLEPATTGRWAAADGRCVLRDGALHLLRMTDFLGGIKKSRHPEEPALRASRRTHQAFRRSVKVEAVEVHYFGPGGDEIADELRLRVRAGIDFAKSPQLRVRTE